MVTIVLSDIIDNRMDMVASGPTCPDTSTAGEALEIVKRYGLRVSDEANSRIRNFTSAATSSCFARRREKCASVWGTGHGS